MNKETLKSQIIGLKPLDSETQIDKLIDLMTKRNSNIDCYLDKWICSLINTSSLVEYYKNRSSTLKHLKPATATRSYIAELLVKYDPVDNVSKVDAIYDELTRSGHILSIKDIDYVSAWISGKGKEQWDKRFSFRKGVKVEFVGPNKIVSVCQPLAFFLVRGYVKHVKINNYDKLHNGDTIFVYADGYSLEMANMIKCNPNIFGGSNELVKGDFQKKFFSENCYVGKFVIGNKVSKGVEEIVKPIVFYSPLKYKFVAPLHPNAPCWRFEMAPIKKSGRTIIVPVDDDTWSQIEELKGGTSFYWEDIFDTIIRFKSVDKFIGEIMNDEEYLESHNDPFVEGYAGDEQGLYYILFRNGQKRKLFKQVNERAVRVGSYKTLNECFSKVLIFDFEKMAEVKEEESSFDILQKKEWILDWNCVRFKNGMMVVYPPLDGCVKFKPKGVSLPGVMEAYNYLTAYLNDRLAPVYCSVEKMELTIYDTIRLNEAIQKFATVSKQKGISVVNNKTSNGIIVPQQMSFNQALSKAKQMTAAEFEKYKSEYIDYLVKLQSEKYKVIPCVERLAHTDSDITEYAFMFSIECKSGDILIVHENVHPDRSTLLFVVKPENYDRAIRSIYDFMQSAEINKRSSLRDGNIEIKQTGVVGYRSINHDDFSSWSRIIKNYKSFYPNGRAWMLY